MSVHVLLNLLNELGENDEPLILSGFSYEFNKFNNTGTQMQDSIYHMTLKSHFISTFALKCHDFVTKRDVFMDANA